MNECSEIVQLHELCGKNLASSCVQTAFETSTMHFEGYASDDEITWDRLKDLETKVSYHQHMGTQQLKKCPIYRRFTKTYHYSLARHQPTHFSAVKSFVLWWMCGEERMVAKARNSQDGYPREVCISIRLYRQFQGSCIRNGFTIYCEDGNTCSRNKKTSFTNLSVSRVSHSSNSWPFPHL